MVLGHIFEVIFVLWPLSEVILGIAARGRGEDAVVRDRGSVWMIWAAIMVSIGAGVWLSGINGGSMRVSLVVLRSMSLVLLLAGLIIRWVAFATLGSFFTSRVIIQRNQRIVRSGLYGVIRHPSYTGLLLSFAGLGIFLANWWSLTAIIVPITIAILYRIHIEESALREAFGDEYVSYCNVTRRLMPGLY
jgi:protein-S-isoprenylcysteine O-methyltransferase Ste14